MTERIRRLGRRPDRRVYLHVGAPKTGSTWLQHLLWRNRERLAANGVCYPLTGEAEHMAAALDVSRRAWGGQWSPEWDGKWAEVAGRIRASDCPTAIFSSELFGLATAAQAAGAVRLLGGAEVHLVFTCRDLARQLPSEWQEQIKHRHTVPYGKFVDDLVSLGHDAPKPFGELFWGLHDPVHVLDRWREVVPPERVHVITGPRPSAPRTLLWERFAATVGLDPDAYEVGTGVENTGLGAVEAEFFRRFNVATRGRLGREYGPMLNRLLGQDILGQRPGTTPLRLPERHVTWVRERSTRMRDELLARGYHVVGHPDELVPEPTTPADDSAPEDGSDPAQAPERLPPATMNAVAYDTVASLLEEVLALRTRTRALAAWIQAREPGALARIPGAPGRTADQPRDQT